MFRQPFKDPMRMRTENKQKICLGESAFQSVDSQSPFRIKILIHFHLPIKSMASWKWELMSAM